MGLSAREGSDVPVTVEQKSLLKNLTPGCLSEEKHCLFDDPHLFDALKAFRVLPLSHAKCQALQDWLSLRRCPLCIITATKCGKLL